MKKADRSAFQARYRPLKGLLSIPAVKAPRTGIHLPTAHVRASSMFPPGLPTRRFSTGYQSTTRRGVYMPADGPSHTSRMGELPRICAKTTKVTEQYERSIPSPDRDAGNSK